MIRVIFIVLIISTIWGMYHQINFPMKEDMAIKKAVECVTDPPKHLGIYPLEVTEKELAEKRIKSSRLIPEEGFVNRLMNKGIWHISLKFKEAHPTVLIHANSGECVGSYGPLN